MSTFRLVELYVCFVALLLVLLVQDTAATRFVDWTTTASAGGGNCLNGDGTKSSQVKGAVWGDYNGDGFVARHDSAEHFSRLGALLFTAMA